MESDQMKQAEQDLQFISKVVQKRWNSQTTPAAIYLLWGVIMLAGFSLVDLAPQFAGIFWMIAAPAGSIASIVIGKLADDGDADAKQSKRIGMHWFGFFVAWGLVQLMASQGRLDGRSIGPMMLLLISIFYYLAGVHLDRRFLLPGTVMAAGCVGVLFVEWHTWLIVGVLMFVCMAYSAYVARTSHA